MSTDKLIFVDTWAWLALANKKDKYHEIAKRGYKEIREKGYLIVTTDYILDEVITALFRNVPFNQAVKFIESLLKAIKFKQITLERVDEDRFNFAWELRKKYQDKPDISFTDLTSFVIMQELGVQRMSALVSEHPPSSPIGLGDAKGRECPFLGSGMSGEVISPCSSFPLPLSSSPWDSLPTTSLHPLRDR